MIRGLVRHVPQTLAPGDELVVLDPGSAGGQRLGARAARLWHEQALVVRAARKVDLVHLPDHRPLLASRTPFVLTVHDVLFLDRPDWFPRGVAVYKRAMLKAALAKKPSLLICDSESTRRRLLTHTSFPAGRVRVILPGVEPPAEPALPVRRGDYFLTVSTIEPRKNHLGLLRAYREARKRGLRLRWKVAGEPGYSSRATVASLRAQDGVDVLGTVSPADLDRLYREAAFVAIPSLGEGFGFPPLEAMSYGVPVVCSRGSALDESAGEAALRVEATDEGAWADALLRLDVDEEERRRLRQAGLERVRRFDWGQAAAAYAAVYREAL